MSGLTYATSFGSTERIVIFSRLEQSSEEYP